MIFVFPPHNLPPTIDSHLFPPVVDYATEIPFQAEVPKGFYETGPDETPVSNIGTSKIGLQQIEQDRRDLQEARDRRDDARKLKKLKKDNLGEYMEIVNKMNDPANTRARTELELPAPMLEDWELQAMAKLGEQNLKLQQGAGSGAAGGLLQSYDQESSMKALGMTGRGGGSGVGGGVPGSSSDVSKDVVLEEAKAEAARRDLQTPLYGEQMPEEALGQNQDFGGVLPARMRTGDGFAVSGAKTPISGGMTPGLPGMGGGMTPGMRGGPGGGPPGAAGSMTPGMMREIQNADGAQSESGRSVGGMTAGGMTVGGMSMVSSRDGLGLAMSEMDPVEAQGLIQKSVQGAFSRLSKPSNLMEVTMPANLMDVQESPGDGDELEEDAQAREERLAKEAAEREAR